MHYIKMSNITFIEEDKRDGDTSKRRWRYRLKASQEETHVTVIVGDR